MGTRPQENQFPCINVDFNDGDEYYLIKNMRYMVALSDYMDDLENRIEVLENALENACERLGNASIICPINNERYIESICFRCEKKCKEPWKEKIMKEAQDVED